MIDFIKVTKSLYGKDSVFLEHCQFDAVFYSGWQKYLIEGCERLTLWYNPDSEIIRLEGSIIYYVQGHNFTYSTKSFYEGIKHLNNILRIDLWDSIVEEFEFGIITKVESKPHNYILNHEVQPKEKLQIEEKRRDKGGFRWYKGKGKVLKLYDAGKNMMYKQGKRKREIVESAGYNHFDNFIKFEVHYTKPEILNNGQPLSLFDLVNPEYKDIFKEDLYKQYKRLLPVESLKAPCNKADISTADILMFAIVEELASKGVSLPNVKKRLYKLVNSFSNDVLSKADKDSRKRQITALYKKINKDNLSRWDLSEKIKQALQ